MQHKEGGANSEGSGRRDPVAMPLFGSKNKTSKSPSELVCALREALTQLTSNRGQKENKKASEDVCKYLTAMKNILYGAGEQEPQTDPLLSQLAVEMCQHTMLLMMVRHLSHIDFEGRKDVVVIFNNLLRRQIGTRNPTVEHLCMKPEILMELIKGYESKEVALSCGQMLRECCRSPELVKIILNSPDFYKFFSYSEMNTFDIATDAFSTLKELITRHKVMSAEFLDKNYDKFFIRYRDLLSSENYVTCRQALKLLGELLLDRHNFSIMTRYISSPENLKMMMTMLRNDTRSIQLEAFHVFKVFVANPTKPQPIVNILVRNRDKLVDYLTHFHTDRTHDEQFNDEKAYLIKQIKDMKPTMPLESSVDTRTTQAS